MDEKNYINLKNETFTCELSNVDADGLLRVCLGQGRYNAMVLKRDGYLDPTNGWIKGGSNVRKLYMRKSDEYI